MILLNSLLLSLIIIVLSLTGLNLLDKTFKSSSFPMWASALLMLSFLFRNSNNHSGQFLIIFKLFYLLLSIHIIIAVKVNNFSIARRERSTRCVVIISHNRFQQRRGSRLRSQHLFLLLNYVIFNLNLLFLFFYHRFTFPKETSKNRCTDKECEDWATPNESFFVFTVQIPEERS